MSIRRLTEDVFRAVSDSNGVAMVRTLPAGMEGYSVNHSNFAMPIAGSGANAGRSASVNLFPGETSRVTVKMQKAGAQALTH
jgi:hypothetical protein